LLMSLHACLLLISAVLLPAALSHMDTKAKEF
jgi:hypothetical protein